MNTLWTKAFAPATVANVSCGFDVFGFALQQPGDEVELRLNNSGKVTLLDITGRGEQLPRDAFQNTAGIAVKHFLNEHYPSHGAEIILHKNLPLGSGMGSSAASAVAALVAVNHAAGNQLSRMALLPYAMEAERVACGAAHADNVAPALLGGFVLIRDKKTLDIITLDVPDELYAVVVHPHIELKTSDARQALRTTLSLTDAITQWGNTAALVAGLAQSDFELIGRAMCDVVAEPVRANFIPGYHSVKQAALKANALGCGISGSGPSVFALCKGELCATQVMNAMQQSFASVPLNSDGYVSAINKKGASIHTH